MSETVSVQLSHPYEGKAPGDRVDLPPADAKLLIRSGLAVPATKPDAATIGVDPGTAATSKRHES